MALVLRWPVVQYMKQLPTSVTGGAPLVGAGIHFDGSNDYCSFEASFENRTTERSKLKRNNANDVVEV